MAPRVTIGIVTLNRAPFLRRALESLKYLDYGDFEVVVVNGPSEDDTDRVLDDYHIDIKIAECDVRSTTISRNMALSMSQGDIIAFVDDDCVPEPLWLSRLVAGFDSENVAAVGGPVFDHTGIALQYEALTCDRFGHPTYTDTTPSSIYSIPFGERFPSLQGTNIAFRRVALVEVGGFDEEYEYFLEETDLCARIVDAGYAIKYVFDAFVHHKFAPSLHYRNDQKVLFNRYPVIKNHLYFGLKFLRHNTDGALEQVISDSLDYVEGHRISVEHEHKKGILTNEDLERFNSYVDLALLDGLWRGLSHKRKLLKPENLVKYCSPYKPFRTLLTPEEKITLCFLDRFFDSPEQDPVNAFDRELAFAAAELGHNVHVITLGSNESTVNFEDKIWVHRVVPKDRVKPQTPLFPHIPDALWKQSWAMYEEVIRISERQDIHILQWPINGLWGIVSLLEQRFINVLSLFSISETATWQHCEKPRPVSRQQSIADRIKVELFCLESTSYLLMENRSVLDSINQRFRLSIPEMRTCNLDLKEDDVRNNSNRLERSFDCVINFYEKIVGRRFRPSVVS